MADEDPAAAADPSRVDLDAVQSLAAFAAACTRLRSGRSYAALERAARPLSLPKATLSDLLNARSTPTRETVIAFLTACGLLDEEQRPWLTVWERVATAHQPRPDGAVRVRDARPRMLGVHAAIQVDDAQGELPPYVPRDLDADLCTAVTSAAANGGLVLMVGGSSVGKTRALFEAVRATLPEWWLLHPTDIPTIGTHAAAPTPRTVLWLDELQRYLNHPAGLTLGVLHRLITAGTVVVATLWPDEYSMRTARPPAGQPDPYADDRDVLRLAHILQVPDAFSAAERRRGEALAGMDRRLRIALDTTDAGFAQVLAAGPALIQRWQTADCYGQAVITAALDARRVGATNPVTRAFLEAAAPAYLTPAQQATAPPDWLDQALAYAITTVHGATGCLNPAPAGIGSIIGWTAADYLHQHARRIRHTTALPNPVWQALAIHHHPDDTFTLADNAARRGFPDHAIALYRNLLDRRRVMTNDHVVAVSMTATIVRDDDINVVYRLVDLLVEHGRVDEAIATLQRHDRADGFNRLVHLLVAKGDADGLRQRADSGDYIAAKALADLLVERGEHDGLRRRADAGDRAAVERFAGVLSEGGDLDGAIALLRRYDNPSGRHVYAFGRARLLADLLARRGDADELIARADAGDSFAAWRLAAFLASRNDVEALRSRADTGDLYAAKQLAELFIDRGDVDAAVDVLRPRAEAGDHGAAMRLAKLFAQRQEVDELLAILRQAADANPGGEVEGEVSASRWLAHLLAQLGEIEELDSRASSGDYHAREFMAAVLAERRDADELRRRADAGDPHAAGFLAAVLARLGETEELRQRSAADDPHANLALAAILSSQGEVDEAMRLLQSGADAGDSNAAHELAEFLYARGDVEGLRERVAAGDPYGGRYLAKLLDASSAGERAAYLRRYGLQPEDA